MTKKLRPHQKRTVESLPDRHGIWHEPGTGKTATAITLARTRGAKHIVIVCPKSLKRNWANELSLWGYGLDAKIQILSKEEFRRDWCGIKQSDCLIVDEAHYHAGFKSQLHKATLAFLKKHNPRYIWLLTGTPILASVMSVWALSRLIGKPLGNYIQFQYRYFKMIPMGMRSVPVQREGIEEQISKDLHHIGDVVSKEEAVTLPDTVHKIEYFELTKEQKRAIKDLDNDPTTITPIVYHTKCLQIANGTLKIGKIIDENGDSIGTDYIEINSEKMKRCVDLVEVNPSCVVVCRQTAELHILSSKLMDKGIPCAIYNGKTPVEDRDRILGAVNNNVVTLLLQADMGIGFNLTGISTMIFYSHSWDYVKYEQCLARIHRISQTRVCQYIHLITEDTVDESVWKCLERKESFQVELYNK